MTKEQITVDVKKHLGYDIKADDVKTEIQECWLNTSFYFYKVLEWPTGASKTLPALKLIGNKKTLIVISQVLHEQNWIKEAAKWNIDLSTCTFVCYNSLAKHIDENWDYIILDEGHRWLDSWTYLLPQFTFTQLVVLSGTLSSDAKKKMYNVGKPQFSTITVENAINWSMLPKPTINVITLVLDEFNPNQVFIKGKNKQKKVETCTYNEWQNKWKFTKGIKRPNLHIQCTEREYYDLLTADIEWAKQTFFKTKDTNMGMRMKMLGNQRKQWLASLKTKHIQKLITKLNGKRLVIFANDIAQAELFDKDAVHSKNKNGQVILDEFNSYQRDLLVSVKQINESINLLDPECGIICQLANSKDSGNRKVSVQNQQRLGRLLRFALPTLYVFVYHNTQDSIYLDKFIESLDDSYFQYVKLSDL